MNYGKHQTFYLRSNWLSKCLNINGNDFKRLQEPNSFFELGLGKNMVSSLKYWVVAVGMSDRNFDMTDIANLAYKFDPTCKSNFIKNILQYNLVSKKDNSNDINAVFYWFFNELEGNYFSKEKLQKEFMLWSSVIEGKNVAEKTLYKDVTCLIQTYANNHKEHPEDKNYCLLADLGLIYIESNIVIKSSIDANKISYSAMFYIILLFAENNTKLSVETLLTSIDSLGKVFNFTRNELISIIEDMITNGYPLRFVNTSGLDTITILSKTTSVEFLKCIYEKLNDGGDIYEI
ncbi:MAG: DUF4007 family protein [Erysipelotrichaceae bacterium]